MIKKTPNPVDQYVGSRVRMQRVLQGVSQEKLGQSLGLTFQQVQKYEKGTNRIGASRLQQIAKVLNTPPSFFFDGAPAFSSATMPGFAEETGSTYVADFLGTMEGVLLNKAFVRIKDPKVRKRIVDLVASLAEDDVPEVSPVE